MKCPDCGTEMKPLAFSMYCPNDCDRKVQEEIDPEKTPRLIYWDGEGWAMQDPDPTFVGPPQKTSSVSSSDQDDADLSSWWDSLTLDTD